MSDEKNIYAVSACLLGENCKYNGSNNKNVTDRAVDAEYDVSDEKDDDEEYEEILSLIKGMRE